MTVYIAGPMTGLPEFNYPTFAYVAAVLRDGGEEVRCPTEHDYGTDKPWDFYMREALRLLLECDRVVLLPGWKESRGARLERQVAKALGMEIVEWEGFAHG
jgi:hypothetical protein